MNMGLSLARDHGRATPGSNPTWAGIRWVNGSTHLPLNFLLHFILTPAAMRCPDTRWYQADWCICSKSLANLHGQALDSSSSRKNADPTPVKAALPGLPNSSGSFIAKRRQSFPLVFCGGKAASSNRSRVVVLLLSKGSSVVERKEFLTVSNMTLTVWDKPYI